jgi:hypothetical protein
VHQNSSTSGNPPAFNMIYIARVVSYKISRNWSVSNLIIGHLDLHHGTEYFHLRQRKSVHDGRYVPPISMVGFDI